MTDLGVPRTFNEHYLLLKERAFSIVILLVDLAVRHTFLIDLAICQTKVGFCPKGFHVSTFNILNI